ncbi:putative uncharacterized transposon-derived protein F54H12.3 [Stylophora pistillata]|uniref:DNA-directed DNA polymerase n=1 Tax=Stylophora pistillata TaxID=50429 RepID=A0A2B4RFM8_STYPI|nr:putative uncharacterized transposon-derived protein F54H12.3 [Stylophora pistillata]
MVVFEKTLKAFKRKSLLCSLGSTSLIVIGTLVGGLTMNPIPLAAITGTGLLLKTFTDVKKFDRKIDMSKFAFTTYEKILTELRSYLGGRPFDSTSFLNEVRLIDDTITDDMSRRMGGSVYDYSKIYPMSMYAPDGVNDPTHTLYEGGSFDIHEAIGKLPRPKSGWTLPGHKYTRPYNDLANQARYDPKTGEILEIYDPHSGPTDAVAMQHDVDYSVCAYSTNRANPKKCKNAADRKMVKALDAIPKGERQWGHWAARKKSTPSRCSVLEWKKKVENNKGESVAEGFTIIFSEGRSPKRLWVDKGSEYHNSHVKDLMKANGVEMYSTENEEKSSVCERWNRTMKTDMWKQFLIQNNTQYLDILPKIVERYNNRKHRSTKMTPVEASKKKNEDDVYLNLYGELRASKAKPKFAVGDRVRISKYNRKVFDKGFTPNWTEEIFVMDKIQYTDPITYKLKDLLDEDIKGSFYEQEMLRAKESLSDLLRIEKVMDKNTVVKLRLIAKEWGLRGYSKLRKAELMKLIELQRAVVAVKPVITFVDKEGVPEKRPKLDAVKAVKPKRKRRDVFIFPGGSLLDDPILEHETQKEQTILKPANPTPGLQGVVKKIEKAVDWGKREVKDWVPLSEVKIEILSTKMPRGKGRLRVTKTNIERKRSVITIKNDDSICLARTIVTAVANISKHKWTASQLKNGFNDSRKLQRDEAIKLHEEAGVEMNQHGSTLEDIAKFAVHLKKELREYCRSDVDILRRSMLQFREDFIELENMDPLQYVTIASVCMTIYRSNYMPEEKIGVVRDVSRGEAYSKMSIAWTCAEEKTLKCKHSKPKREQHFCSVCAEKRGQKCNHSDGERSFVGTWCTNELNSAIEKGYEIKEIFEIKFNAGKRAISKMCLKSLWGKFGQRNNMKKTVYATEPAEFYRILLDDSINDLNIQFINGEMVEMNYKLKDQLFDNSRDTNIFVAAFTTSHARMMMYREFLEPLREQVLGFDTDSVWYVEKDGEQKIKTGDSLGDATDELDGCHITD